MVVSLCRPFCRLPSGYVKIAIENGPVEIGDLPINSMVFFHSFLYVYQAGYMLHFLTNPAQWCSASRVRRVRRVTSEELLLALR